MPNTFDVNAFLADQSVKQSPGGVPPQAAQAKGGMQDTFDVDSFLGSMANEQMGPPPEMVGPMQPEQSIGSGAVDNAGLAFAQNFTNAIVPQGMVDRLSQSAQGPISPEIEAAKLERDLAFQKNIEDHPLAALTGTGFGVIAGGALGNGVASSIEPTFIKGLSALTANKVSQAAKQGITDLALLSTEAGMFSVLNDNPNTFKDAAESFAKGASIAGALGLGLKGLQGANDFLTEGAKVKNLKEIKLAEKRVGVVGEAASRAERMAAQAQAEAQAVQSSLHRHQALLSTEPAINERVSLLPNRINEALDMHLQPIREKVLSKINAYKDVNIDPIKNFQNAIESLEASKVHTPDAIAARDSAIQFTKGLMNEAYLPGGSPQDVLIGTYKAPKATVDRLYKQNSQFGDLLYNRDFMSQAPKEVQATLRKLQKSNRDLVASVDPTGELSQYMDFEHSLLNAKQRDGFALDAPDFFKSYSKNSNDPSVLARWRKFQRNLMSRDEVAAQYGKSEAFDAGLKPETLQNIELKQRAENLRSLIDAEVNPATTDYAVLNQAKQDIPKLQQRLSSLNSAMESSAYKAETRSLAKDRAQFTLDQKRMDEPTNALEALLPAKLRTALHLRRNLNDSVQALTAVESAYANSPSLQNGLMNLQKVGSFIGKGLARGLATRTPSLLGLTKSTEEQP